MNCQGDLAIVEAIEKVIRGWNEVRLIKDGSVRNPLLLYQTDNTTLYSRVYELYVGSYVFPVRLTFDKRQGDEKGRMSIPDINRRILFRAVHGLSELVDKLTPMTGDWRVLDIKNHQTVPSKVS